MIRGIIFDLGNTLLEFKGDWEKVIKGGIDSMTAYFAERGYPMPVSFADNFRDLREHGRTSVYKDDIEYTTEQILNDVLAQHNICWIPDAVLPVAVAQYFQTEQGQWVPYKDTQVSLAVLKELGYKMALLSNATDHAHVVQLARNAEIEEFFDPLLSSALISHRKPDPRAFQPILNRWQLPASEVVMVGDVPSFDILGAHRAGIRGILHEGRWDVPPLPHADFEDAELLVPDAVITELSELPDVIRKLDEKDSLHVV